MGLYPAHDPTQLGPVKTSSDFFSTSASSLVRHNSTSVGHLNKTETDKAACLLAQIIKLKKNSYDRWRESDSGSHANMSVTLWVSNVILILYSAEALCSPIERMI